MPSPRLPSRRRLLATLLAGGLWPLRPAAAAAGDPPPGAGWVHAHAVFGSPKYPPGFSHFDYARPDAPKGGTLYLRNPDRRSSFDKFNPFTAAGNSPAGLMIFMFESLTTNSGDELQTMYGLLAEALLVAPDRSAVTFRLHAQARFANGDPVTAEDVKHSFEQITGKYASPAYRSAFAGVARAVVLDARTVRFDLESRSMDTLFTVAGLPVFSRKWGRRADGTLPRFDEIVTDYPLTSGPYTIVKAENGRRLELVRNPDYWARDLGVRRGFFNFDRVVYRYYGDAAVAREAFKAGEFDILKEYGARSWVRQHKGPKWDDGRIRKDLFETAMGQGLQSYQLNLRRPIFQDRRVRAALDYTYDFDTLNKLGQFKRAHSLFNNSEFGAVGLPSAAELRLLEPFRRELPAEVFGPAYEPPSTGRDPLRLRANLLKARALLAQAGWTLASDGRLRNAKGEPFDIEYLVPGEGRTETEWQGNMDKLGIQLKIRSVDYALYRRRLEEYDFDMVTIAGGTFTLPDASGLTTTWGSQSADEKGNNNFRGVRSAAVDSILVTLGQATTLEELRTASRALDRVVMWNHWQVPDLYGTDEKASFWNKFGMPATRPLFFKIDTVADVVWPLMNWWALSPK